MRTGILFLVYIAIAARTLSGTVAGPAPAPWFGTWKLNLTKSTANPDPRFKKVTLKIELSEDGLKVTYDMIGTRGGLNHMEWTGKFDGKDYAVQGVDYVLTNAYSRVDDRSYKIVVKVDGAVVATSAVSISPDGKTLTAVTAQKNAQGRNVTTAAVYERQ